ncbi:RNA exonuclease 4-like [Paramacrobiotus metropolitanus]|uniref:RNA exonuclease 4-like n=1 Tax=Paramacrobiotus metropolitanus TaxID=2943436 RepID=UPI0024464743|nr:RNA exonuclease 4-like [Paramacrobiotus metropolitanus]
MDTGPVIHIVSTKSSNSQSFRAKPGQQPNRNRVIPAIAAESVSDLKHDRNRVAPWKSPNSFQEPNPSQNYPRIPAANSYADSNHRSHSSGKRRDAEGFAPSSKRTLREERHSDLAKPYARDSTVISESGGALASPLLSENSAFAQDPAASDDVDSLPRKKKKPLLTVPTRATIDVSKNWTQLKTAIGAGRRPKRIVQPATAASTQSDPNSAETASVANPAVGEIAEIPEATAETFVKTKSFNGLTKAVAMDCEFVGVGPGGQENMLARVSLVNLFGHCLYDTFVKPTELVKDYRTHVSGVRPQDLKKGEEFKVVQAKVAEILRGRILIGHAVSNDLEALLLSHPKGDIRDTSKYKPFRILMKGGTPSLKKLTAKVLGVAVQTGEHDSIQDAQATMRLYTMHKRTWESTVSFRAKKAKLNATKRS